MSEVSSETRFIHAIEMGLGAWQWGDRSYWQYGNKYGENDVREAFQVSIREGIRLIDTAEAYGNGSSEQMLGKFIAETDQPILVATKYFPYPWRWNKRSVLNALKGSIERIGVESIDIYQIHWPSPLMNVERMMDGMIECVSSGLTRTIGVSNFNQTQMLTAYSALTRQGIPLASNQMPYSLLNRKIEKNGLLARCKELGIRLIAYSPLGKGLLTGKYDPSNPPPGPRGSEFTDLLPKIEPLLKLMTLIGQDHGGKTNAEVALNWVICKGALPIPGAKILEQARQNARALGWRLSDDEITKLDDASDQI